MYRDSQNQKVVETGFGVILWSRGSRIVYHLPLDTSVSNQDNKDFTNNFTYLLTNLLRIFLDVYESVTSELKTLFVTTLIKLKYHFLFGLFLI